MKRHLSAAVLAAMTIATIGCGTRVERTPSATAAPASSEVIGDGPGPAVPTESGAVPNDAGSGAVSGSSGATGGSAIPGGSTGSAASGGSSSTGSGAGSAGSGTSLASGSEAATGSGSSAATKGGAAGANAKAPKSGAPTTPGIPGDQSKEPIKIGAVGVFSGPIGTNMKPINDAVRIWMRWINDRGGINGRPVTMLTGDSAGDPARHRALVQQLVEKGVVAFVGQPGEVFSGQGSVEYLTQQRVPVIGSEGAAHWFYESPVFFPQIQHSRALVQGLAVGTALEGKARGLSKLAIWTCVEAQTCKEIDEVVPKVVPKHGAKVVNNTKISIGQPDFTAECLNTRNSGAEMIFMAADGSTITRGAASCARQGYRPTWVLVGATILAKQHAEDPNLGNGMAIDTQAPWFLDNTPARKEWRDAVDRYAPGLSTTSSSMIGWIAGKLFEYAAKKAAGPLTRETLLASLWASSGDPLPELTVPYIFTAEKPATPTTCFWLATPENGKWTSSDGGQRHCFPYDTSL